ncbi:MAG TPA: SOS response-associated peptidase [Terriglobia bacterium]|nr:SOS response-associated peptidase [Terriglobia bacterium]
MCGRYQLKDPKSQYELEFSIKGPVPNWKPRVNFCPTNYGPFVTAEHEMRAGHWGLIASWEKEGKMQRPTFNARAETVFKLPTFRSAYKSRRCIVPADAFYEWSGPKGNRIPHEIKRKDGKPLALAGLWETWEAKDKSERIVSYTIIITTPNEFMKQIHDRMPVILEHADYDKWLNGSPEEYGELMKPAPENILEERIVNKALNRAGTEGDWLLDPQATPPLQEAAEAAANLL